MNDAINNSTDADHAHHDDHSGPHVMSAKALLAVFSLLIGLTLFTVWVAQHHLGRFDFMAAMIIATFKASLVALFFMHLKYDKPLNSIILIGTLLFVAVFLGFTLMDSAQYENTILWKETLPNFQK